MYNGEQGNGRLKEFDAFVGDHLKTSNFLFAPTIQQSMGALVTSGQAQDT